MCTFKSLEEIQIIPEKKRSVFKRALRLFLQFTAFIAAIAVILVTLLFVYEKEVKAEIIKELNTYLNAEVKIDPNNIDLTILKSFPDCSIEFKEVLMFEALPVKTRDTLLYAGRLNLYFNIQELWNKNYTIKKIKLKDAVLKLAVLKDGKVNYQFWKKTENKEVKKDSLSFQLKLISIQNLKLSYKDIPNSFKTKWDIQQAGFSGKFSDEEYEMSSDIKALVHDLSVNKTSYIHQKKCDVKVIFNVSGDSYQIVSAKIKVNALKININGNFTIKEKLQHMSLSYQAPDLDIAALLSLLPEQHKTKIDAYESTGNFFAEGKLRYSSSSGFSSLNDFGIKNGTITYKPASTSAKNITIAGHLELTDKTSFLNLKNIHLNLNTDEIKGSCSITNFSNPELAIKTDASVNLENIQNFWPIDTLSLLKGKLLLNGELNGALAEIKQNALSDKVDVMLTAKLNDAEIQFKGDEKIYKVLSCDIAVLEKQVAVKDLKLQRGRSDITVSGKAPGLFKHLLDRSNPLVIDGSLESNFIDMDDLVFSSANSSKSTNQSLIPANMFLTLNATIHNFKFGKFEASGIKGEVDVKNQKMMISNMNFKTMKGEAEFQAFADNSKNRLDVTLNSRLTKINITDMFSQLNNFGQSTLTQENLKGLASATIDYSGTWSNDLIIDEKSIQALGTIILEGGELINFKPMLSLAKFVEIDNLTDIKFSTLESKIEIKNRTISIPKTDIKNSALNLQLSGTHTFDNEINYHIQLLISDLLAKKRKNKDDEFGPVEKENNKRSAFISMTGTVDQPIIKYDRSGLKQKLKDDLKEEKQTLKNLLKEEFGMFKKDTMLKKPVQSDPVFEIEKPSTPAPKKTIQPKKKKQEEDDF